LGQELQRGEALRRQLENGSSSSSAPHNILLDKNDLTLREEEREREREKEKGTHGERDSESKREGRRETDREIDAQRGDEAGRREMVTPMKGRRHLRSTCVLQCVAVCFSVLQCVLQ